MSDAPDPHLIPAPMLGGFTVAECGEMLDGLMTRIQELKRKVTDAEAAEDPDARAVAQASLEVSRAAALQVQALLQRYEDAHASPSQPRMSPAAGQEGFVTPEQISEFRARAADAVAVANASSGDGAGVLEHMEPRGRA